MRFSTKHVLTTLLLAFGLAFGLDAQELNVTGTITDATDGTPLIGATLRIKDTNRGTVTDYNGEYSLKVASDATLILDYTGYASQEIPVTGQTILNLTMESSATDLGEVVVVGFGTKKKANVTGASSFVKMDKLIGDRPVVNSAQALQGIAAGLQVISSSGQPGSTGTSLNIRGTNSINGGSPLVLVNNVPMSINDVNPRDIESVTVLKDAAASSIYGARAAFGVILITTKKAGRNQPIRFNYGTTNTLSSPAELPQKATTRQFVEALSDFGVNNYFAGQEVNRWLELLDSHENDPGSLTYLQDPVSGENYPIAFDADNNTYYPLEDSDIIGDFLNDEGFSTIHNLGVSGGGENLSFRINGGYSFEDGIMVTDKDKFKKYNINAYLGADISPRLKSTTNIFYRRSDQSLAIAQYSSAIQLRGYDPTGFFETEAGEVLPFASPGNVVRYRTPSTTNVNNLRLFQSMEFSLAKNFKIIGEYTFEKRFTRTEAVNNGVIFASTFRFVPNLTAENAFAQSRLSRGNNETTYNSLNLYGKYELGLGDHNFNLLGGFNREKQVFQGVFSTRTGLIDPNLPTFNLSIGDVFDISDSYSDWAVLGLFSRLSYNFREKYFLEANLRYDGSSRFPTESRWVALPSFSAGWNVAREPWFEGMADAIPLLKFRASWGEIGNQNTSDVYPAIPGYEDYNANWVDLGTDQRYLTLSPAQLVSNSFTWEKVRTTNFGVDVGFLKGRLSTSFDVYSRETIGMLSEGLDLPSILGTEAPDQNIADLKTTGWELELGWKDRKGPLSYGLNFNLFDNRSEITRFQNESGIIGRNFEGRIIGDIWGYVTDGFYTIDDFVEGTLDADLSGPLRQLRDGVVQIEDAPTPYPGDIRYRDLNGDGVINAGNSTLIEELDEFGNPVPNTGPGDRQVIGNTNRRFQFGFNGYVAYKNLDLSFIVTGVGKRDGSRNSDLIWPYPSVFDHIYAHQLDYWTPDNQDAFYPRVYGDPNGNVGSNYGSSRRTQTKYLTNEAYLRIQNVTLGYSLPQNLLDRLNFSKLRVFVAANNLHTFDSLPEGLDPDQGSNGVYPLMKSYSAGINLSF